MTAVEQDYKAWIKENIPIIFDGTRKFFLGLSVLLLILFEFLLYPKIIHSIPDKRAEIVTMGILKESNGDLLFKKGEAYVKIESVQPYCSRASEKDLASLVVDGQYYKVADFQKITGIDCRSILSFLPYGEKRIQSVNSKEYVYQLFSRQAIKEQGFKDFGSDILLVDQLYEKEASRIKDAYLDNRKHNLEFLIFIYKVVFVISLLNLLTYSIKNKKLKKILTKSKKLDTIKE